MYYSGLGKKFLLTRVPRCSSLLLTLVRYPSNQRADPDHQHFLQPRRHQVFDSQCAGSNYQYRCHERSRGLILVFSRQALQRRGARPRWRADISPMMLLAVVAELDLGLALPRFLPQLGARSARAVSVGYLASSVMAVALTAVAVLLLPHFADSFAFMSESWTLGVLLIAAVVLWNIFALQDAVLTALRKAAWIPVENTIFGIAKLVLMVVWAKTHLGHGIFISWVVPMGIMIIPVTFALFRYAIPQHARVAPAVQSSFWRKGGRKKVVKYLVQDYIASLMVQCASTLLPIVVVLMLGAEANGYFYVAFTIAAAIDHLGHNVGLSLTVESAFDERQLSHLTRHTFKKFGLLLCVIVAVIVIFAPWLTYLYGPAFHDNSTGVLRLLVLGTVAQTVLNLYQAVERTRGNGHRILIVTTARLVLVMALVIVLAGPFGLIGVGLGWLIGHTVVMVGVMPSLYRLMRK